MCDLNLICFVIDANDGILLKSNSVKILNVECVFDTFSFDMLPLFIR